MQVLLVEFGLNGLTLDELNAASPEIAPAFAEIPGCLEKTWITDAEANTAGGVYKFRDRAALDAYVASDLFDGVRSNPSFVDLRTRVFGVMEHATEITHGVPAGAVAS